MSKTQDKLDKIIQLLEDIKVRQPSPYYYYPPIQVIPQPPSPDPFWPYYPPTYYPPYGTFTVTGDTENETITTGGDIFSCGAINQINIH